MIKVQYDNLEEAFDDYNGAFKEYMQDWPDEVWEALEDCFAGGDFEFSSLSMLFDNLYINDVYTENIKNIEDEEDVNILFVDEDGTAYVLD